MNPTKTANNNPYTRNMNLIFLRESDEHLNMYEIVVCTPTMYAHCIHLSVYKTLYTYCIHIAYTDTVHSLYTY